MAQDKICLDRCGPTDTTQYNYIVWTLHELVSLDFVSLVWHADEFSIIKLLKINVSRSISCHYLCTLGCLCCIYIYIYVQYSPPCSVHVYERNCGNSGTS